MMNNMDDMSIDFSNVLENKFRNPDVPLQECLVVKKSLYETISPCIKELKGQVRS